MAPRSMDKPESFGDDEDGFVYHDLLGSTRHITDILEDSANSDDNFVYRDLLDRTNRHSQNTEGSVKPQKYNQSNGEKEPDAQKHPRIANMDGVTLKLGQHPTDEKDEKKQASTEIPAGMQSQVPRQTTVTNAQPQSSEAAMIPSGYARSKSTSLHQHRDTSTEKPTEPQSRAILQRTTNTLNWGSVSPAVLDGCRTFDNHVFHNASLRKGRKVSPGNEAAQSSYYPPYLVSGNNDISIPRQSQYNIPSGKWLKEREESARNIRMKFQQSIEPVLCELRHIASPGTRHHKDSWWSCIVNVYAHCALPIPRVIRYEVHKLLLDDLAERYQGVHVWDKITRTLNLPYCSEEALRLFMDWLYHANFAPEHVCNPVRYSGLFELYLFAVWLGSDRLHNAVMLGIVNLKRQTGLLPAPSDINNLLLQLPYDTSLSEMMLQWLMLEINVGNPALGVAWARLNKLTQTRYKKMLERQQSTSEPTMLTDIDVTQYFSYADHPLSSQRIRMAILKKHQHSVQCLDGRPAPVREQEQAPKTPKSNRQTKPGGPENTPDEHKQDEDSLESIRDDSTEATKSNNYSETNAYEMPVETEQLSDNIEPILGDPLEMPILKEDIANNVSKNPDEAEQVTDNIEPINDNTPKTSRSNGSSGSLTPEVPVETEQILKGLESLVNDISKVPGFEDCVEYSVPCASDEAEQVSDGPDSAVNGSPDTPRSKENSEARTPISNLVPKVPAEVEHNLGSQASTEAPIPIEAQTINESKTPDPLEALGLPRSSEASDIGKHSKESPVEHEVSGMGSEHNQPQQTPQVQTVIEPQIPTGARLPDKSAEVDPAETLKPPLSHGSSTVEISLEYSVSSEAKSFDEYVSVNTPEASDGEDEAINAVKYREPPDISGESGNSVNFCSRLSTLPHQSNEPHTSKVLPEASDLAHKASQEQKPSEQFTSWADETNEAMQFADGQEISNPIEAPYQREDEGTPLGFTRARHSRKIHRQLKEKKKPSKSTRLTSRQTSGGCRPSENSRNWRGDREGGGCGEGAPRSRNVRKPSAPQGGNSDQDSGWSRSKNSGARSRGAGWNNWALQPETNPFKFSAKTKKLMANLMADDELHCSAAANSFTTWNSLNGTSRDQSVEELTAPPECFNSSSARLQISSPCSSTTTLADLSGDHDFYLDRAYNSNSSDSWSSDSIPTFFLKSAGEKDLTGWSHINSLDCRTYVVFPKSIETPTTHSGSMKERCW